MTFLLLLALLLCCLLMLTYEDTRHGYWTALRQSILKGLLLMSAVLVAVTELLSALNRLSYPALVVAWALVAGAVGGIVIRRKAALSGFRPQQASKVPVPLLVGVPAVVLGAVLVIGLLAPPTNWDSMTYHMARVMHWIQNGTLLHYPSHIMRQHYQPPFAEQAILHLYLLSGVDSFANLVQWTAWASALVSVSLVTRLLGGTALAQGVAVCFAATLPMAILQGSSTQNDLVVAFFVVALVHFLLRLRQAFSYGDFLFAGLALGLALLSKGTAYIFVFPWLAWFGLDALWRRRLSAPFLRASAMMGVVALLLNAGHYYRNTITYGHPLGGTPEERSRYVNAEFSPRVLLSNISRNAVLHLEAPPGLTNYYWLQLIRRPTLQLHQWLGLDLHDSRTTLDGELEFKQVFGYHEDYTGNFFHMLLALGCTGLLLWRRRTGPAPLGIYAGLILLSFLLFCGYLRWQIWAPRLHTPVFILLAPYCAVLLASAGRRLSYLTMGILVLGALPAVFYNESRPLLPPAESVFARTRNDLLFSNKPDLAPPFREVTAYIARKGYRKVGLLFHEDTWEYPVWALLAAHRESDFRIRHVLVTNPSGKRLEGRPFEPDCILASPLIAGRSATIRVGNRQYDRQITTPYLVLYNLREGP